MKGIVQTKKVEVHELDSNPQVCYENGSVGWIVARVKGVHQKPIWELENGDKLTPEYFYKVIISVLKPSETRLGTANVGFAETKELPLEESQWEFALNDIGVGKEVEVSTRTVYVEPPPEIHSNRGGLMNVALIPYATKDYRELRKAALKKLSALSEQDLKVFLGKPTGTLLADNDKQLLEEINKALKNNRYVAEWLKVASRFTIDRDNSGRPITIESREQRDGSVKWVLCNDIYVLSKDGYFEYEPLPSSRTDKYLKATRYEDKDELLNFYLLIKNED
jgi:hypothetical protein